MGNTRIDPAQLRADLSQFTGTEQWYRHGINRRMLFTDGVKYFAEQAGCYWFLDIIATEVFSLLREQPFLVITMDVDDGEADIFVDDGNGNVVWKRHINFTDAPDGDWRFYLTDNVLMVPSEY